MRLKNRDIDLKAFLYTIPPSYIPISIGFELQVTQSLVGLSTKGNFSDGNHSQLWD